MMSDNRKKLSWLILYLGIFAGILILHFALSLTEEDYYWDASAYLNYGRSLFANGHYSLENLADCFRGYVFPSFIGIIDFVGAKLGITWAFYVFSSLLIALGLLVTIRFMEEVLGYSEQKNATVTGYLRRLLPVALLLLFFWGIFVYPLSDIYALLVAVTSVYVVYTAGKKNRWPKMLFYLFGGVLGYAAYNIRTIYLFLMVVLALIILYQEHSDWKWAVCGLVFFIIGAAVSAYPQVYANYKLEGVLSPFVQNQGLFAQQLYWGLEWPRYETYVGTERDASMYFIQRTGEGFVMQAGEEYSIGAYIRLAFKYPLEIVAILGTHIINAFFPIFPEQYVSDLGANRYLLVILSQVILFTFFRLVRWSVAHKEIDLKQLMYPAAVLLPSLVILAGAVEQRFTMPFYLFIFFYISYFDYSKVMQDVKKNWYNYRNDKYI